VLGDDEMRKKAILFLFTIMVLILLIFFLKFYYKFLNSGNNMNIKSIKDIEEYILNVESYQLIAEITVSSNKNSNKYIVKQEYIKDEKIYKQEGIAPADILGLTITYNNSQLKIEQAKLKLTKIYEDYPYIMENCLSLQSIFEEYQKDNESKSYEDSSQIILETFPKNGNKYTYRKKLYIDKLTGKPIKMEVLDVTQKTLIHILYNEVKINELSYICTEWSKENE